MSEQWYVEQAGQVEGPVPSAVIMARRFAGFLQPDTRLSRDGHSFKTFKEHESEGAFGEPVQGASRQNPPAGIAVVCPHCGHENHAPRSAEGRKGKCPQCKEWLIVHEGVAEPLDVPIDLSKLRVQVQAFVRQQLKTPASAQFSAKDSEWKVEKLIDGGLKVTSVVDAQNVYGAILRHEFTCAMKKDAGNSGRWSLNSIQLTNWDAHAPKGEHADTPGASTLHRPIPQAQAVPVAKKASNGAYIAVAILVFLAVSMWLPYLSKYGHSKQEITLSEYHRIQNGISYGEVARILGAPGKEMGRNRLEGVPDVFDSLETVMFQWVNEDGSGMNAIFQNNKLVSKAQHGLR